MKIYPELTNKRAISLLRVSTKKQTSYDVNGVKDDIPVQREINNEFIEANQMNLVAELIEPGVSASKVPLAKREKLQEIFKMAENKEFDVLVVFKHDRLSRIQEEYPIILSTLNKYGIRIFVALDGTEKKSPNAEDGLMNSVEGYTAAKESRNIKERVTSSHRVVIRQGKYRGGLVPFGYTTANLGETNLKGQLIQSIVINEEEAEVVKLIFDLCLNKLMGIRKIAEWLNNNGFKQYRNDIWSYQTIRYILHNETYKGYLHFTTKEDNKTFKSEKRDDLVIIDEDIWDKTQEILKKKVKKSNKTEMVSNSKYSLVSGLIFCGYCGSRLGVWTNHKSYTTKNEKIKYVVHRYRCNRKSSGKTCNGQTTYGLKKIDNDAEASIIEYMTDLSKMNINKSFVDSKKIEIENIQQEILIYERNIDKKERQLQKLKDEIPNSLIGESVFSPEELKKALIICEQEYTMQISNKEKLLIELHDLQQEYQITSNIKSSAMEWLDKYKKATFAQKKLLISKVIKKIIVYKENVKVIPHLIFTKA